MSNIISLEYERKKRGLPSRSLLATLESNYLAEIEWWETSNGQVYDYIQYFTSIRNKNLELARRKYNNEQIAYHLKLDKEIWSLDDK